MPKRRAMRAMARSFGAEGIGLCRTEHMFFDGDRIVAMREMILADTRTGPARGARQAFADAALGFRRTVRDHGRPAGDHPPARSAAARIPAEDRGGDRRGRGGHEGAARRSCAQRTDALHEFNPMLGHRGCRLAVTYPEIAEMQARAIFEAAVEVGNERRAVVPEIMVPLVAHRSRSSICVKALHRRRGRSGAARDRRASVAYLVGTMIELPRAAFAAGDIAGSGRVLLLRHQRPDADDVRHLARRRRRRSSAPTRQKGIVEQDPFVTIDAAKWLWFTAPRQLTARHRSGLPLHRSHRRAPDARWLLCNGNPDRCRAVHCRGAVGRRVRVRADRIRGASATAESFGMVNDAALVPAPVIHDGMETIAANLFLAAPAPPRLRWRRRRSSNVRPIFCFTSSSGPSYGGAIWPKPRRSLNHLRGRAPRKTAISPTSLGSAGSVVDLEFGRPPRGGVQLL